MARNKYPEETVNHILEVSQKLFWEKGYDHTSIQDIINGLGGLTKGAIYHHFKSKEEIMLAVAERICEGQAQILRSICNDTSMTGIEAIRELLKKSLNNPSQAWMLKAAPNMINNPRFLAFQLNANIKEAVPQYLQPLIERGIADGTIQTEYPRELAEVMLLLLNFWINPLTFGDLPEVTYRKASFIQHVLRGIGIDVIDDSMIEKFSSLMRGIVNG